MCPEEQINNSQSIIIMRLCGNPRWEAEKLPYFLFVENFLSTLYMCYKELDERFAVVHGKKVTKKARVEATVLNNLTQFLKPKFARFSPMSVPQLLRPCSVPWLKLDR